MSAASGKMETRRPFHDCTSLRENASRSFVLQMGRLRGGRGLTRSPGSALPPGAGDGLGSELGTGTSWPTVAY